MRAAAGAPIGHNMRVSSFVSSARLLARHPQLGWTRPVLSSMLCWARGGSRSVWNERVETGTAARAESFYDSTVERVGALPLARWLDLLTC